MTASQELDEFISAFCKIGDYVHKVDEYRRLTEQINKTKSECGSCYHWMKTSQCPKEASGIKVSCAMPICSKFEMDGFTAKFLADNEAKAAAILEELKSK